ncbi:MAG TPA: serine/threonine-protein kinase [Polyangiaceae bacterium]|nr:serine/threonine-protein kinase [Polyangiaceae bacterium]
MFPQVFGKYVLERELGRGGMARVFLATLRGAGGFEKRLVVKQIRPELASNDEFVQRFVAEAKTAVSLSHPNIVPVYELGVEQGTYFIAMELCEGVTLAELLQRRILSAMEGAYVGAELCRALDYAHRRSVVHRDITPRNVLIDAEGAIRLIDFGIAGSVTLAGQERQVFGSLGHMAPEHVAGGEVGPPSDLFSLGTVLIEAWTGRAPFRRDTLEETNAALLQPTTPLSASNSELAPLDALLHSTVNADSAARPQGAEQLGRPLREFLKIVDTTDVARRLGKTVAQMLDERVSRPPPPDPGPTEVTTSKAGGKTQTFAVHRGFDELTQPLVVAPAGPPTARSVAPAWRASRMLWVGLGLLAGLVLLIGLVDTLNPTTATVSSRPRDLIAASGGSRTIEGASKQDRAVPSKLETAQAGSQGTLSELPSDRLQIQKSDTHPVAVAVSAKPPAALGMLTLSAEPPCQVLVDGKPRGRTPIRQLALSVGNYRVEFISDLTDERLSTSVLLGAGEHDTLHADFTAATPRIVVR